LRRRPTGRGAVCLASMACPRARCQTNFAKAGNPEASAAFC
jgi:hypothetical protein